MLRVLCKDNNFEYAGEGYLQCRRRVICPKKSNNRILGFDCLIYIDNLPDGCKLPVTETELLNMMKVGGQAIQEGNGGERKEREEKKDDKIVITMDLENRGVVDT